MSITWKTLTLGVAASALVAGATAPANAGVAASTSTKHTNLLSTLSSVTNGVVDTLDGVTSGVTDTLWGDDTTKQGKKASRGPGSWDASLDLGSMYNLTKSIGAQDAWATGVTGNGVTVALIDTGVVPVPGIDKDDKVTDGPDLSFESQSASTRYLDGYGHGTHMAGIIAGKDEDFDPKHPSSALFAGVAPDSKLLSMKVGTGDGGTDVTQVIAAIDWVVAHSEDQGMHVRVINLSYGTESTQSWQVDPLARAVENAWNHGILVVASAGNDGLDTRQLVMPAADPHILAVGAVDNNGTAASTDDDIADFTNGGNLVRHSDVLAPGKSVVSLRDPGSFVDQMHPEGLVPEDPAQRFFRGSGTSQAAAVVAGEAALLFSAEPKLTPDQVKTLLMNTARPLPTLDPAQGAGVTSVSKALSLVKNKLVPAVPVSLAPSSTGLGSLDASRGGEHVVDPGSGDPLDGQTDALGSSWNAAAWAKAESTDTAWVKGAWNGRTWTGTKWDKRQLQAVPWTGNSWDGTPWANHAWPTDDFAARSWRGNSWKARSWREETWAARSWRDLN
jgi:serine protease AprX